MFGSAILEVAIGIVFVFVLVSIICSTIREAIEAWLKSRAAFLEFGIRELLHDRKAEGIVKIFYKHPLISCLFSNEYEPGKTIKRPSTWTNGSNLPSYIPSRNFAIALMDIAARGPVTNPQSSAPGSTKITVEAIRDNIQHIENEAVQRILLTALDTAEGDLNRVQANIEAWYNSSMDRVSGWYRRSTQWALFWSGLAVAVVLNVNIITIGEFLYRNENVRTAVVARAELATKDTAFVKSGYNKAMTNFQTLGLPIGWENGWGAPRPGYQPESGKTDYWNTYLGPVLGWLLTAFAATMGAPFWFDLLNKIMVIRSTVKPHEKSGEEGSEDRQPSGKTGK